MQIDTHDVTGTNAGPDSDEYLHQLEGYYQLVLALAERCLRRRLPHTRGATLDPADITQTVFLRLLGYRAATERLISDAKRFIPYVRVVVRHEVADAVRREGGRAQAVAYHLDPATAPAPVRPEDTSGERAELVQRALDRLPNDLARCVFQHLLKGESIKDIANELHLKPNVVSQTKCRFLKVLRRTRW